MTVLRAPITIGIIVTFMVHSFYNSLAQSRYLSLFSLSFNFNLWSAGTAKSTILQVLFFSLIIIRCSCLAEIWWSVCISKSQCSLCVSFSRTDSGLWSNFNFLHNLRWIILSTQSCLYFFYANLLHLFIMWLIVSSLSPHYHYFCIRSILLIINIPAFSLVFWFE